VHPSLIAALAEDRRSCCPCGAVTGQPLQLCRNCLAGMMWRRHISRRFQSVGWHRANRLARAWSWTIATAAYLLRIAKVARS
jgi:hypothetical protein